MTHSPQKVAGQLNSIRGSLMDTIIALRAHENRERAAGNDAAADQLAIQRLRLNDLSIVLWDQEAAALASTGLDDQINGLIEISTDARKAANRIKTTADALAAAAQIIELLEKLMTLLG